MAKRISASDAKNNFGGVLEEVAGAGVQPEEIVDTTSASLAPIPTLIGERFAIASSEE